MDAYVEEHCVYFSIGNKTSYARYQALGEEEQKMQEIKTATYQGSPPYKVLARPMPTLLKQYHAAEHKVYNSFMQKIKPLPQQAGLSELAQELPSLDEARSASSFSLFCGTTIFISSTILLLGAAVPYFFKLSTNPYFMFAWLACIVIVTLLASYYMQKNFYLAQADDKHLLLAIEALKEVLKDERNDS